MARQIIDLPKKLASDLSDEDLLLLRDIVANKDKRLALEDLATFILGGIDTSKLLEIDNKEGLADGSYIVKKTGDSFTVSPYVEPEDNVKLLYELNGAGSSISTGNIEVPFSSLVWDGSQAKYSKVVLTYTNEVSGLSASTSGSITPLNSSNSAINCTVAGHEIWGTGNNSILRTQAKIMDFRYLNSVSVGVQVEFLLLRKINWIPYFTRAMSGNTSDCGSQKFDGRVETSVNNIAKIRIGTAGTSGGNYKVRLWGYK